MTGGPESAVAREGGETTPRAIESRELLAGHREVHIRHGEDVYKLKLTSNNKLILMK